MFKKVMNLAMLAGTSLISAMAGASPPINIDTDKITLSGISSGGQMAHQMHIAYPDVFSGVGIIAGGPFGCAGGSLATAMSRCMASVTEPLPLDEFVGEIRQASEDNRLGATGLLADDPVWIFHGTQDTTVAAELSEATVALYKELAPTAEVLFINEIEAAHTFPTVDKGSECTKLQSPFIGDCGYDAAGELLQHLYGPLNIRSERLSTELQEVLLPGGKAAGLNEQAYLFVPALCVEGEQACKTHLVLHGCAQSVTQVGKAFIEQSGYLAWAEANHIVLAFPQVSSSAVNPFACWDWWGYGGAEYRWRDGAQMKVLADWMLDLAKP